jgi:YHS domain-containing protein
MKILLLSVIVAICTAGCATAADQKAADPKAAAKGKPYPLKTCVVSDEKLGDMGDPYVFTYQGREVKLCCKGCLDDFNKEPAKYVKKIEAGEKKK